MRPILIIVSTFNRPDLTGITLDSLKANKSASSDVLIIDDASTDYKPQWLDRWGWPVMHSPTSVGVGKAAFRRFDVFARSGYQHLCTLDNDILVAHHFDLKSLDLFYRTTDDNLTAVSPYRSSTQEIVVEHDDYMEMMTINGISQFVDLPTARRILKAMTDQWEHPWDANISKILSKIVVPKKSLIQHLGIHGTGVNGMSTDVAVGFDGL